MSSLTTAPSDSEITQVPAPVVEQPVLGVQFHCLTIPEAVARIEAFIREGRPRQICLSNAYTVTLCQSDESLRRIANQCALNLADGMSIVWGSRWQGSKIPQRVGGPDLMAELCARAAETQRRIFLLGSTEENLNRLAAVLQRRWPTLQIAGLYSPPMCDVMSPEENEKILQQVNSSGSDILFVGLSAPKQEKWIATHLSRLKVPVSIGVGAAFNFLSGQVPRAPESLQRIGLEWLYRLYREPRRLWKRYLLGNAVFLSLMLAERARDRITRQKSAA